MVELARPGARPAKLRPESARRQVVHADHAQAGVGEGHQRAVSADREAATHARTHGEATDEGSHNGSPHLRHKRERVGYMFRLSLLAAYDAMGTIGRREYPTLRQSCARRLKDMNNDKRV